MNLDDHVLCHACGWNGYMKFHFRVMPDIPSCPQCGKTEIEKSVSDRGGFLIPRCLSPALESWVAENQQRVERG